MNKNILPVKLANRSLYSQCLRGVCWLKCNGVLSPVDGAGSSSPLSLYSMSSSVLCLLHGQ